MISHPEGWRKVGRAKDPISRLRQHQYSSGALLVGEAVFKCDDAISAERTALNALRSFRIMGEWHKIEREHCVRKISTVCNLIADPFPVCQKRQRVMRNHEAHGPMTIIFNSIFDCLRKDEPSLTRDDLYVRLSTTDVNLWVNELPESRREKAGANADAIRAIFARFAANRARLRALGIGVEQ